MSLEWDPVNRSYRYVVCEFAARPVRGVDGDTSDLLVDMGLRNQRNERFRLLGINAPELHDPDLTVRNAAIKSTGRLNELLQLGDHPETRWPLRILTLKDDSFGRWLATIFFTDANGIERNINTAMLSEGLAVPYHRR